MDNNIIIIIFIFCRYRDKWIVNAFNHDNLAVKSDSVAAPVCPTFSFAVLKVKVAKFWFLDWWLLPLFFLSSLSSLFSKVTLF